VSASTVAPPPPRSGDLGKPLRRFVVVPHPLPAAQPLPADEPQPVTPSAPTSPHETPEFEPA
jgi:hypothetical protein